jgi:glycosyltransferase involved in cell wall biosynthesis
VKKILLISYFFPPANAVAGHRAASWAENLKYYGIDVTVVTRHWSGNESGWKELTADSRQEISFERNDHYAVYRLPSRKIAAISLFSNNLLKNKLFSKLFYVLINAFGYFNAEADAYASFRKFLKSHLKKNTYDCIVVTSPPLNLIRLAKFLNHHSSVPVHVDFRDLWNNGYLMDNYHPPFNLKIIDAFKSRYIKGWLKNAGTISAVSEAIAAVLERLSGKKVHVLTNGYDEKKFSSITKHASQKFRFTLAGTYYIRQPFDILIKGLLVFLKDKSPDDVEINLIGVSVNKEVIDLFTSSLPAAFLNIKERVSSDEAAQYIMDSEILFQAAWKGYKGIYTTKIFDFVASGNYVVVAPGDQDVISHLITSTNAGIVADSVEEFTAALTRLYAEWKENGMLRNKMDSTIVQEYSRKKIAGALAEILKLNY